VSYTDCGHSDLSYCGRSNFNDDVHMMSFSVNEPSTILYGNFSEKSIRSFENYASLSVTIILNFILLASFYDATWAPADDGIYAHLGERILSGEIANRDFQSIHAGHINFVNAASMWMFGPQLVSLRYPIILIGLLQAAMIHLVFSRFWPWLGVIASVSLTGLGIIQYFNPTAHWYCHVLFVALIGVLHWTKPSNLGRVMFLGYLIGTIFLFRQLTGVIGGIGLVTYLLIEPNSSKDLPGRDLLFSRLLLGSMGVGLTLYFFSHGSLSDFLLFGLCPIAFISLAWFFTTCNNSETFRIIWKLSLGTFFAFVPLLFYHLIHNSMTPWVSDTIFQAINLSQLPVFSQREYGQFIGFSLHTLMNSNGIHSLLNGTYLFFLPILSFLNGGLLLWTFLKKKEEGQQGWVPPVLPFLAMFYAVVSIIYPVIIYLYLTVGLSLLGLLWQLYTSNRWRIFGLILSVSLSIVAIHFHAGQPLGRSWAKFMAGEKVALAPAPGLEKLSLKIEPAEGEMYSQLVRFIRQQTTPNEPIFVFPNSPEIYFLADRPNPYRFYYLQLDVMNVNEGRAFIQSLKEATPALIIFNSSDINNTEVSFLIAKHVQENYFPIKKIGEFEIFSSSQL